MGQSILDRFSPVNGNFLEFVPGPWWCSAYNFLSKTVQMIEAGGSQSLKIKIFNTAEITKI